LSSFDHFLARQPRLAVVARFDPAEVAYLRPVLRIPFSERLLRELGVEQPAEIARDIDSAPAADLRAIASAVALAEGAGPAAKAATSAPVADRAGAPAMPASPASSEVDDIERKLRMVWHNLLGETPLSREAGFFELGATSLTALKLVRSIRQHWNVGFDAADVFGYPTLRIEFHARVGVPFDGSGPPASRRQLCSRNPTPTMSAPKTIAYAPIIQTSASAPAPGDMNRSTPKTIERIPLTARSHSPRICLRSRIAAAISATPVSTAQTPITKSRASAVIPGHRNVSAPAAMLTMPSNTNHPQGRPVCARRNAVIRLNTPSTSA
jgi:hypothetical protein